MLLIKSSLPSLNSLMIAQNCILMIGWKERWHNLRIIRVLWWSRALVQEMKSINHAKLSYLSKLFLALWCWHVHFTPIIIPSDKVNSSSVILICTHFPEPLIPAVTFSKTIYPKDWHFPLEVNSKLLTSGRYNPNFHLVYSQCRTHSLSQRARSLLKLKPFALHEISGFRQCNHLCIY